MGTKAFTPAKQPATEPSQRPSTTGPKPNPGRFQPVAREGKGSDGRVKAGPVPKAPKMPAARRGR